ncbi:MAG: kynureninase [Planctomycetota bacterium]
MTSDPKNRPNRAEAEDLLLRWRERFPITSRANYLISNSLGAMPRDARESLSEFQRCWDERGVRAWGEVWWELQERVAAVVERVIGAPERTVSMHQNVASATAVILSCFSFDGYRNRIVYSDRSFPSDQYACEAMAARGAVLRRIPGDGQGIDLERFLDAIDERTRIVAIDHVLFRSAFVVDAKAVAERAREKGAFLILDVFHSCGTMPLKLREWGVHAAVGGALKYMCGGPGNCFLYVDPDARSDLRPSFTGWAAHRDPFAFSIAGQDYRDDAGRFHTGTPNIPALYAGRKGIEIVAGIGLDAIRAKSRRLTSLLVEEADRAGLPLKSPRDPERRGGHVALDVPHGHEVCRVLAEEDIVVDYRPDAGLRIAPHFYNTEDEVRQAVRRVREILDSGDYRRFEGERRRPG